MKFIIKHESRGRMRVQLCQSRMTLAQADLLQAWLHAQPHVLQADVHERTCCAVVTFRGDCREQLLSSLRRFSYSDKAVQAFSGIQSGRAINRAYQEKLVGLVCGKAARSLFLPAPLQAAWAVVTAVPYVLRGLGCLIRRQMHVELLDGLSIGISLVRRDFGTAGSVMFLLRLGELLEEWTHKRSVDNLARSMSLNIDRVWLKTPDGDEILVPLTQVQPGDRICVRTGGMIPLDSVVDQGEVTVNQASLTGESIPVPKRPGSAVYAGTVVEEGECVLLVRQHSGSSRYDKIVSMIEQSEKLKSAAESRAANQTVECTAGDDNADGGKGDEDKEGDRPGIAHAVIDGLEHLEDADRRLLHRVEGAGHGHSAVCGLIHHPVKLAGGEDPGEDGADDDDAEQQNIDVRQLDAFFLF